MYGTGSYGEIWAEGKNLEHHAVGNVIKGMAERRPHTGSAYSEHRGPRKTKGRDDQSRETMREKERAPMMREGGPREASIK